MARLTRTDGVVIVLCLAGFFLPVAAYWLVEGRAPAVSSDEARDMLARTGSDTTLIDVRSEEEFDAGHVDGARNWPYESVLAATSPDDVPQSRRGRKLLLICAAGWRSSTETCVSR